MRISVAFPYQLSDLSQLRFACRVGRELGCARAWSGQSFGLDPLLAGAALSKDLGPLGFGVAVTLMPLRHPLQAGLEARTLASVLDGPVAVGLGVSERAYVEGNLGSPYERPLSFARDYVSVVKRAVASDRVDHDGPHFRVHDDLLPLDHGGAEVLLGALNPRMAALAGEIADGCVTWLAPAGHLERTLVPAVAEGARDRGREVPPVVALAPFVATTSRTVARRVGRVAVGTHIRRPHYRKMLRAAGLHEEAGEPDLDDALLDALVNWGSREDIAESVRRFDEAGVDELVVCAYLDPDEGPRLFERTVEEVVDAAGLLAGTAAVG